MAIAFDSSYYLKAKLAQLHNAGETDADGQAYTLDSLTAAITAAGMTPEEHYNAYGRNENLNPNAYFNQSEYLTAKLKQLNSTNEKDANGNAYTMDTLVKAIADAGLTPEQHYEQYGAYETNADGTLVNPSNAFDANAYFQAKLAQLQKVGEMVNGKDPATMTVAELVAVVQEAGLSPVTHYAAYGAGEAGSAAIPLVQTVPVSQRVANDPARATVTGEVVPTNYNPATAAPGSAEATAKPVTKPADVGGLIQNEAVSPTPIIPTKAAPVPGDAGYMAPPPNITDTATNPVIPPSSADSSIASGNWLVVNKATGTATVVDKDGHVKGDVKIEISTGSGGDTVTIPKAEDKPVTELPPAENVPPSVIPGEGDNVKPSTPGGEGGDSGGDTPGGGEGEGGGEGGGDPETPVTPPATPTFKVVESAADSGIWTIGKENGAVTLTLGKTTADNDSYVFTPATGDPVKLLKTEVTSKLVVPAEIELKSALAAVTDVAAIDGKITLTDATLVAATANTFATKVTGAVKATITADTATNLVAALQDATVNDYTLTVNAEAADAATTAAQLNTLNGKTSVAVGAAAVTKITGSGTEFASLLAAPAASDGGVTLGTAFTATVTGTNTDAAVLKALNAATTGLVTATATTTLTGSAADVKAVVDAEGDTGNAINLAANVAITVNDTDTLTAADAKIITDATTGIVTAKVSGSAADLAALEADTDGAGGGSTLNALTFTVTGTEATAKQLNDIDARTDINVDVATITTITGTLTELNTLYTNKGHFVSTHLGDENVNVTAVASSDFTNLGTVLAATTGTVTAEIVKAYAATDGTIANLYANDVLKIGLSEGVTLAGTAKGSAPGANGEWNFAGGSFSWFDGSLKTIALTDVAAVGVAANGTVTIKPGVFAVTANPAGTYTVGNKNGNVTVTVEGDDYVFTPATPSGADDANVKIAKGSVTTSLTATDIVLQGTAEVLAGIKNLSSVNTKILGPTYSLADLAKVNTASTNVTLETANVALSGAHADLTTALTGVTGYVGNLTATDKATIAELGALDLLNGDGTLTADKVEDTGTNLAGADGSTLSTYIKAGTEVTVSDSGYTAAQLKAINDVVGAGKLILTSKAVAMSADLAVLNAALDGITDYTGVLTVTDKATIAQLTTLDGKNGVGAVTGKIVEDSIANLLPSGAASALIATDAAVTVTDSGSAALADLVKLDTATTGTVTADKLTTLTGSSADAKTVVGKKGTTGDKINFADSAAITINDADTLTAADAKTITDATTGVVTAKVSGSATDLAALETDADGASAGTAKNALTITVSASTASAIELNKIDAMTDTVVNAAAVTGFSGDWADVKKLLDAEAAATITLADNFTATVSTDTITAANAIAITGATTGIVTASVSGDFASFSTLEADVDGAGAGTDKNALTITVTDTTGTLNAADLTALRAKTSASVEVADAVTIKGTSAELLAALDTSATKVTIDANSNITVDGTVSSGDLAKFLDDATGSGTITIDNTGAAKATLDFGTVARALTINGGSGGDTITGGTLADSITLESAKATADTVNINFNSTTSSEASNSKAATFDTIAYFAATGASADKLVFVDANTTDVSFSVATTVDTGLTVTNGIVTGLTGANAKANIDTLLADTTNMTAGKVVAFKDGSDTYVVMSDGDVTAKFDVVVKLAGVSDLTGIAIGNDGTFTFTA